MPASSAPLPSPPHDRPRARRGLLPATLLLLAGCVSPPASQPSAEGLPASWQAPMPAADRVAALQAWWQQGFDDPLFGELVAQAQATHPGLAQATARIRQARAAAAASAMSAAMGRTAPSASRRVRTVTSRSPPRGDSPARAPW